MNLKLLTFKLKKNLWADIIWAYKSAFHWSWIEFAEHREYIPWDEIKHIDWKISARTNKLYIKKYEEERNLDVLFVIDTNPSINQFKKKYELLKEIFFILGVTAVSNNDKISILLNNKFIQANTSKQTFIMWLKELEKKHKSFWDLDLMIEKIKNIKWHLIFILTDKNYNNIEALKKLQLQNDIIYINYFHYFENNLELIDWDLNFTKWNQLLSIDLSNEKKIQQYQKLRHKTLNEFKKELIKSNIDYLYLDTKKNAYKEFYKFFMSKL